MAEPSKKELQSQTKLLTLPAHVLLRKLNEGRFILYASSPQYLETEQRRSSVVTGAVDRAASSADDIGAAISADDIGLQCSPSASPWTSTTSPGRVGVVIPEGQRWN